MKAICSTCGKDLPDELEQILADAEEVTCFACVQVRFALERERERRPRGPISGAFRRQQYQPRDDRAHYGKKDRNEEN